MERLSKRHGNRGLQFAFVLACLVLVSIGILPGVSARFATKGNVGDTARVAAFQVTDNSLLDEQTFDVMMAPPGSTVGSSSQEIWVKLKNESETTVQYTISFELDGNLPVTVTATGDNSNLTAMAEEGSLLTCSTIAAAVPGTENQYEFSLDWMEGDAYAGYQYSEGIESVTVSMKAVQED